jgi:hypothetical protein
MHACINTYIYGGPFAKLVARLIIPSRNYVEVRWQSLFRSTSLGKRCISYNAPPTFRKRAADRWSLRNFLLRSCLFMVEKAQKSHGARSGLYGGCSNEVSPIHFSKAEHRILYRSRPNGLLHVFGKWVKRCEKCIACQGMYFEKETVTAPPQSFDSE